MPEVRQVTSERQDNNMYALFPARVSPSSTHILNGTSYGPNSGLGRWGDGQLSKTLVLPWNETCNKCHWRTCRSFKTEGKKSPLFSEFYNIVQATQAANILCHPGLFSVACKSHWTSGKDITPILPCIPEHPQYRKTRDVTDHISHRMKLVHKGKTSITNHPWRSLITPAKYSYANIFSFPLPLWVLQGQFWLKCWNRSILCYFFFILNF